MRRVNARGLSPSRRGLRLKFSFQAQAAFYLVLLVSWVFSGILRESIGQVHALYDTIQDWEHPHTFISVSTPRALMICTMHY
ncbi:hypothetical protein QVD17_02509 [Tagetes erecta]|uniref:Uncharacterized protein n=1 Tax=Tagetes erecta TaxID=13708 RepID=A0AAD8P960_TARER|nr:hypothetical protein QVD17_02509 [Tagetes erecta]